MNALSWFQLGVTVVCWIAAAAGLQSTIVLRRTRRGLQHSSHSGGGVSAVARTSAGAAVTGASIVAHVTGPGSGGGAGQGKGASTSKTVIEGYAIGFRSWLVKRANGVVRLYPIGVGGSPWEAGELTAECLAGSGRCACGCGGVFQQHTAPDFTCSCGFYAFKNLALAGLPEFPSTYSKERIEGRWQRVYAVTQVWGAVRARGRVIEHGGEGFRAEKSEIIALLRPGFDAIHMGTNDFVPLRRLADTYGVPLLNVEQLEEYAFEYGKRWEEIAA